MQASAPIAVATSASVRPCAMSSVTSGMSIPYTLGNLIIGDAEAKMMDAAPAARAI